MASTAVRNQWCSYGLVMVVSAKRKIGAKRRVKKAVGLEGLIPNLLPEVPSFKSILRQLLAGLLIPPTRSRRVIRKTYQITEISKFKVDLITTTRMIVYQATIKSAVNVLGEMIYSTPIITSALAQGWKLSLSPRGGFNPTVPRLNHEAVFSKAVIDAKSTIAKLMNEAKRGKRIEDIDLYIINPAPYLNDARPETYWNTIMTNAWRRQQALLPKQIERDLKKAGL